MAEFHDLEFQFKGKRDYVHGTDIFNEVCRFAVETLNVASIVGIEMNLHKIMRTNLKVEVLDDPGAKKRDDTCVTFSFTSAGVRRKLFLSENGAPVEGRYPYPEEDIINASALDVEQRSFKLSRACGYSDIEIFVAMNKGLLDELFPSHGGKWYFTKLELAERRGKTGFDNIELKLIKNVGLKLTKSSITVDGRNLGNIFFSLVK